MDRKKLEKKFPNLSKEMDGNETVIPIQGVRVTEEDDIPIEKEIPQGTDSVDYAHGRIFSGYDPGPIDFLRRCRTKEEAIEIINYLERKNQISKTNADKYRKQLYEQGLESFGTKKEWGHYEKTNRIQRP